MKKFKKGDRVYWYKGDGKTKIYKTISKIVGDYAYFNGCKVRNKVDKLYHVEYRCDNGDFIREGKYYRDEYGHKVKCIAITQYQDPLILLQSDGSAGNWACSAVKSLWKDTISINFNYLDYEVTQETYDKIMEILEATKE